MNHAMGSDIYHYDESGTMVPDLDEGIIEKLFLNYYEPFYKGVITGQRPLPQR